MVPGDNRETLRQLRLKARHLEITNPQSSSERERGKEVEERRGKERASERGEMERDSEREINRENVVDREKINTR